MIDLPLDSILAIGSRELARLESRYRSAAARIAPGAPLDSVIAMMRRDHPTRDGLLDEVRALLADLRDFCVSSKFISIPSGTPLAVRPTPEYAASRSFASFDGPGPLETKARDSYYNVTMPAHLTRGGTLQGAALVFHRGRSTSAIPATASTAFAPGPEPGRRTMGCSPSPRLGLRRGSARSRLQGG
jgi:hypothetical protein